VATKRTRRALKVENNLILKIAILDLLSRARAVCGQVEGGLVDERFEKVTF
jgi:hypothetical protein